MLARLGRASTVLCGCQSLVAGTTDTRIERIEWTDLSAGWKLK